MPARKSPKEKMQSLVDSYHVLVAKLQDDPTNRRWRDDASTCKTRMRALEREFRLTAPELKPIPPIKMGRPAKAEEIQASAPEVATFAPKPLPVLVVPMDENETLIPEFVAVEEPQLAPTPTSPTDAEMLGAAIDINVEVGRSLQEALRTPGASWQDMIDRAAQNRIELNTLKQNSDIYREALGITPGEGLLSAILNLRSSAQAMAATLDENKTLKAKLGSTALPGPATVRTIRRDLWLLLAQLEDMGTLDREGLIHDLEVIAAAADQALHLASEDQVPKAG